MSFLLTCPHCGTREVTDFGFGGEVSSRPKARPTHRELNAYAYFRRNAAGLQREWWVHRSGCGAWFLAERDTTTNEVLWTATVEDAPEASPTGGTPASAALSADGGASGASAL
jgi:heterotetrameric sarcosine oxidase delta subunit